MCPKWKTNKQPLKNSSRMKQPFIILLSFLLLGSTAKAQFNKPLQSASSRTNTNEAKYNIGLMGGLNSTYWLHAGGTKTKYNYPFNFGITGGLAVERMLSKSTSVSLEGYYSMRNLQLNYDVLNFPTEFPTPTNNNGSNDFYRQLNVDFQEVNVQALYNYFFSNNSFRPYVFVGPRISVPMSGKMVWQKKKYDDYAQHLFDESYISIDTVEMNAQNTWQWNIGLVAGIGIMYKLNVGNYYFLIKADVSAHASLAYFSFLKDSPYIHASLVNSFTYEEKEGLSQNVIGAGYIDPYLLGMRFNTDAMAKITFMFPLKKQLQGACIRWGEYD